MLADWPPVPASGIPTFLAGLTDQSLLIAIAGSSDTRYRALETVRQYGVGRLEESGESVDARSRHLRWCLVRADALDRGSRDVDGVWRAAYDEVADELRSALAWANSAADFRVEAYRLAIGVAQLSFLRGMPGESQRRYEQAAELAADEGAAADAWRHAAGAAESRNLGDDALRLRLLAVEAAIRAGDRAGAAGDLAHNAEWINRGAGILATEHPAAEAEALIARGWELADDNLTAQAQLLTAEAFASDDIDPATADLVERALTLARQVDDPRTESAALDQLTSMQLAHGEVRAAVASAMRRTEILAPVPVTATTGLEFFDSYLMAAECQLAAGDLPSARRLAERLQDLPFCREEGHLASARLLVVAVLAGDWSDAAGLAERFREGWQRAGRPQVGNLRSGAYAAATMYGLRGDDDARAAWLEIVGAVRPPGRPIAAVHFGELFDGLLLLHRGHPDQVMHLMTTPPEDFTTWYAGMWRPWYAALWAEAAVLIGSAEATDRVRRARVAAADNPIATAIVDRAAALTIPGGDRDQLAVAAGALHQAGCRYQWARTLILLGGADRVQGEGVLASMGATPMVWPSL